MKLIFNDGKELEIQAFGEDVGYIYANLYTDNFLYVANLVYIADKSIITLESLNDGEIEHKEYYGYTDITSFSSLSSYDQTFVEMKLSLSESDKQSQIAELQAQIDALKNS